MIEARIQRENLRLFLEIKSEWSGYVFDPDWDWDAIRFGLEDTDAQQDSWFAYDLSAGKPLNLRLAWDIPAALVRVQAEADEAMEARIVVIADLMRRYRLNGGAPEIEKMIDAEFAGASYPPGNIVGPCRCPECRDCLAFFQDKHWRDLIDAPDEMQCGYGGLAFLTPPAWRFFVPAYMVAALRYRDRRIREAVSGQLEDRYRIDPAGRRERLAGFNATQRAVIELFLRSVKTDW